MSEVISLFGEYPGVSHAREGKNTNRYGFCQLGPRGNKNKDRVLLRDNRTKTMDS
jgi:hypothetical protein